MRSLLVRSVVPNLFSVMVPLDNLDESCGPLKLVDTIRYVHGTPE